MFPAVNFTSKKQVLNLLFPLHIQTVTEEDTKHFNRTNNRKFFAQMHSIYCKWVVFALQSKKQSFFLNVFALKRITKGDKGTVVADSGDDCDILLFLVTAGALCDVSPYQRSD